MTSRDFCFWLQGALEMKAHASLTDVQVESVKRHLAIVLAHEICPSSGGQDYKNNLNAVHGGIGDLVMRC